MASRGGPLATASVKSGMLLTPGEAGSAAEARVRPKARPREKGLLSCLCSAPSVQFKHSYS